MTDTRNNTELDLDTILEREGVTPQRLDALPEELRGKAFSAYISAQLESLKNEHKSFSPPEELLDSKGKNLLDALERVRRHENSHIPLELILADFEYLLRNRLQPFNRFGSSKSSLTAEQFRSEYLTPYLETLSRLKELGLDMTEKEALQKLLDDLEEDIKQETLRNHGLKTEQYQLLWKSNTRRVEECVNLYEMLESPGLAVAPSILRNHLYSLILTPKAWVRYSRDGERVTLFTPDEAVSIQEERLEFLEELAECGYAPVNYRVAAKRYCEGLDAKQDFSCSTGELRQAARTVLGRLEWFESKGVDLSETYGRLKEEAIAELNRGTAPGEYIPLLDFLAEHDAFDRGQLALLKATTYK